MKTNLIPPPEFNRSPLSKGVNPGSVYELLDYASHFEGQRVIEPTFTEALMLRLLARKVIIHSMRHLVRAFDFDGSSEAAFNFLGRLHDKI